jgi:two-component sensor histidine kinase
MTEYEAVRPGIETPDRAHSISPADPRNPGPRIPQFVSPLYLRLAILLAAAMLPAAIYSVFAAYTGYRESHARTQETIVRLGEVAASRAQLLIDSTRRLLIALAVTDFAPTGSEGQDQCTRRLVYLVDNFAEYSAFAVIDGSGRVVCSSGQAATVPNVSDQPWFQQVRMTRDVAISQLTFSKSNNTPVVVVAVPLGIRGERFRGAISVGINVVWLAGLSEAAIMPSEGVAFLINRGGMVVTRSGKHIESANAPGSDSINSEMVALPNKNALQSALDQGLGQSAGKGSDGIARLYSVTSLGRSDLFVVLGVPESSSIGWARRDFIRQLFAAMAVIFCAMIGAAVGGELLAARGLRALSVIAQALQRGDYTARPDVKGGSSEVRQLADALTNMAERVQRHERDMSRLAQQKDAMLKEIHHRVKNNLQVVTSLMSIQANRLSDGASKRALAELQRRVRALGLLHRYLYEGDDLRYLDFGQFTTELCQMVKESSGLAAHAVAIEVDIPPIPISADRAVPLGLLITEALSNALKHGFPGGRAGIIRIGLTVTPEGVATIAISDNGIGSPPATSEDTADSAARSGTGMILMQAFAQQLNGVLTVEGPPGTTVRFSIDLAEPEIIAPA